jgi:hypothetical protein
VCANRSLPPPPSKPHRKHHAKQQPRLPSHRKIPSRIDGIDSIITLKTIKQTPSNFIIILERHTHTHRSYTITIIVLSHLDRLSKKKKRPGGMRERERGESRKTVKFRRSRPDSGNDVEERKANKLTKDQNLIEKQKGGKRKAEPD